MRACVVVPARDERARIAGCLEALAVAIDAAGGEAAVVLVDDGSTDGTRVVAEQRAHDLRLTLHVVDGPGTGAGGARRAGMDHAVALLGDAPDALIATTDADTLVAPDWLARQLALVEGGAVAIAGDVRLDPAELATMPPGVLRRRERDALERLRRVHRDDPAAEHHHFGGASIGVTAQTYARVGGLEPRVALEDAGFAERLRAHGVAIARPRSVHVTTSARPDGRAARGLAVDLDVARWSERRRYEARDFGVERLRELKGSTSVAVVLPAKDVAATVGDVLARTVGPLREAGIVDDVLVVDASSPDGTAAIAAAQGARVLDENAIRPEQGPCRGKGDAMWRAIAATDADVVAFLDADTRDPTPDHLAGLLGPLLLDEAVMLVKGTFSRPRLVGDSEHPDEGGRVTELMARPLINLKVPRLAGFGQPLAGETAGRRELLERLSIPVGYGVEVAMLIDALELCGLDALAECALGERRNRHQPLRALGEMAYAVLAAVESRAGATHVAGGHYVRPWQDGATAHVPVEERPPIAEDPDARA